MAGDLPAASGAGHAAGKGFLDKKVAGGLTGGTLIVIVGGAVVVVLFLRKKNSSSTSAALTAAAQQAAATQAAQDQLYGSGGSAATSTGTTTATSGAAYADNTAWQQAAVSWLVAHGYDGVLANQAVGDYLAGNTLTPTEHAMINLVTSPTAVGPPPIAPPPALTVGPPIVTPPSGGGGGGTVGGGPVITPIQGGSPPGSIHPPVPVAPAPVPVQSPPQPSYTSVTVSKFGNPAPWNSTIWGISQHYGIANWQTVWDDPKNAGLRSKRGKPELIQPGDVVYVPTK